MYQGCTTNFPSGTKSLREARLTGRAGIVAASFLSCRETELRNEGVAIV